MGVNPQGILEGVASRPTGRAGLQRQAAVRAGNASGIPGSGKRAGRLVEEFSQPELSRPTQLWISHCSTGKWGWRRRAPTPPGSLSPGEQDKKSEGGRGRMWGQFLQLHPKDRQMDRWRGSGGLRPLWLQGVGRDSRRVRAR